MQTNSMDGRVSSNSPHSLYQGARQYHAPFTTSPAPGSAMNQNLPKKYLPRNEESREQALIDWVNSFNDPYCLLVNSIIDLTDGKLHLIKPLGIALCHLVGFVACTQSD